MQFFLCIWVAIPVDWVILHWCACGADGQINGRPVGQCTVLLLPNFLGWVDLLSYGAPLLPQSTLSLSVSLLSSPSSSLASSILVTPSAILQWNLFLWNTPIQGTPLFRRHKILSRKNVHIIFVSVTSIEETHTRQHLLVLKFIDTILTLTCRCTITVIFIQDISISWPRGLSAAGWVAYLSCLFS